MLKIERLTQFTVSKNSVSLTTKKTYLDTTFVIKLWKHSIERESFNLAPMSSQKASSTKIYDIGVVLLFRSL